MWKEIIFIILVFFSNIIQTLTGFAGTMLAMPGGMLLIGINEAKAILNVMGLAASLYIATRNFSRIDRKEFLKIAGIMFVGMIMGLQLFRALEAEILLTIYGLLIVFIAAKNLLTEKKMKIPDLIMLGVILIAGVIHGMFVSGGALLVVYAASKFTDKSVFRATLAPVWVLLNGYMLVSHLSQGYFTGNTTVLTLISFIPLALAIYLGNLLHDRINQKVFMKITYVLLLASGIMLLV